MLEQFNKEKPPTFDGEVKKEEDTEAWLLAINKYFILHDYSEKMKVG